MARKAHKKSYLPKKSPSGKSKHSASSRAINAAASQAVILPAPSHRHDPVVDSLATRRIAHQKQHGYNLHSYNRAASEQTPEPEDERVAPPAKSMLLQQTVEMLQRLHECNGELADRLKEFNELSLILTQQAAALKQEVKAQSSSRRRMLLYFCFWKDQNPTFAFDDVFPPDDDLIFVKGDGNEILEELDSVDADKYPDFAKFMREKFEKYGQKSNAIKTKVERTASKDYKGKGKAKVPNYDADAHKNAADTLAALRLGASSLKRKASALDPSSNGARQGSTKASPTAGQSSDASPVKRAKLVEGPTIDKPVRKRIQPQERGVFGVLETMPENRAKAQPSTPPADRGEPVAQPEAGPSRPRHSSPSLGATNEGKGTEDNGNGTKDSTHRVVPPRHFPPDWNMGKEGKRTEDKEDGTEDKGEKKEIHFEPAYMPMSTRSLRGHAPRQAGPSGLSQPKGLSREMSFSYPRKIWNKIEATLSGREVPVDPSMDFDPTGMESTVQTSSPSLQMQQQAEVSAQVSASTSAELGATAWEQDQIELDSATLVDDIDDNEGATGSLGNHVVVTGSGDPDWESFYVVDLPPVAAAAPQGRTARRRIRKD